MNYKLVIFHTNTTKKIKGSASVTKVARHIIELKSTTDEKAFNSADNIIKHGFRIKITDTVYDWVSPHAIERIRIVSMDTDTKLLKTGYDGIDVSDEADNNLTSAD